MEDCECDSGSIALRNRGEGERCRKSADRQMLSQRRKRQIKKYFKAVSVMPFPPNVLQEVTEQMVLELWENKEVLARPGRGSRGTGKVKPHAPFFFKSLPCFSILDMGVLMSGSLKPCVDGVFRDKMESYF